jgi:hypothetical protein
MNDFLYSSPPAEEKTYVVPITGDRERGIAPSSIKWTNQPPSDRHRKGPENVIYKGFVDSLFIKNFS